MRVQGRAAALAVAVLGTVVCAGLALAAPVGQQSIQSGVFTADQVAVGEEVFEDVCSDCHTNDIFGPDYMTAWSGATVGEFFAELQATMPYENPGTLEDKQYAAVIVYLFALNGVAAGDQELPADVSALYEISIDGPFKWNGSER